MREKEREGKNCRKREKSRSVDGSSKQPVDEEEQEEEEEGRGSIECCPTDIESPCKISSQAIPFPARQTQRFLLLLLLLLLLTDLQFPLLVHRLQYHRRHLLHLLLGLLHHPLQETSSSPLRPGSPSLLAFRWILCVAVLSVCETARHQVYLHNKTRKEEDKRCTKTQTGK